MIFEKASKSRLMGGFFMFFLKQRCFYLARNNKKPYHIKNKKGKRGAGYVKKAHDFSQGSAAGNITRLASPLIFAQPVKVLYSRIDPIYIGPLPYAAANRPRSLINE